MKAVKYARTGEEHARCNTNKDAEKTGRKVRWGSQMPRHNGMMFGLGPIGMTPFPLVTDEYPPLI